MSQPVVKYESHYDLMMNNLMNFYKDENNLTKMLKIIMGETKISLRIIDWFVTNYAKKNYTVYMITDANGNETRFKVHIEYKQTLEGYHKKKFDPFCRTERICIPYKGDKSIETTIGQLKFIKWAIENKVIEYIEQHFEEIEKDMLARNSTSKRKEVGMNSKTRKKREELSMSAIKTIIKENVEITVKFHS